MEGVYSSSLPQTCITHQKALECFNAPATVVEIKNTPIRFTYDAKKYPKVAAFEKSGTLYVAFCTEFRIDLNVIKKTIKDLFIKGILSSSYNEEFTVFEGRLFEPHTDKTSFSIDEDMPAMYGVFREMIRTVVEQLQLSCIPDHIKAEALSEILLGLVKCAPGLITSIEFARAKLIAALSDCKQQLAEYKVLHLRNLATEYAPTLYRSLKSRQVYQADEEHEFHYGTLLCNSVAEDYGLPILADRHLQYINITDGEADNFKQFIAAENLPIEFWRQFISSKLRAFYEILSSFGVELEKRGYCLTLDEFPSGLMSRLEIEFFVPLATCFPKVPALTLLDLNAIEDDYENYDFSNAGHIFTCWLTKHYLDIEAQAAEIAKTQTGTINTLAGVHFWVESINANDKTVAITLKDIVSIDLTAIPLSMALCLLKQSLEQTKELQVIAGFLTIPEFLNQLETLGAGCKRLVQNFTSNKMSQRPELIWLLLDGLMKYFNEHGPKADLFDLFPHPEVMESLICNYHVDNFDLINLIDMRYLLALSHKSIFKLCGNQPILENFISRHIQGALDDENMKHLYKLITYGANVNKLNKDRKTALMLALEHGHKELFDLLIQRKEIKFDLKDENGMDAFLYLCRYGTMEQLNILAKMKKMDLKIKNSIGQNCLHLASLNYANPDLLLCLLNHCKKIDINVSDNEGKTMLMNICRRPAPKVLPSLLFYSALDVNKADTVGRPALYYAVGNIQLHNIKTLLKMAHIKLNVKTKDGTTLLHKAIASGQPKILELLLNDPRTDVNLPHGETGKTPLSFAIQKASVDMVELLMSHYNIKTDIKDKEGLTSIDHAEKLNVPQITALLSE